MPQIKIPKIKPTKITTPKSKPSRTLTQATPYQQRAPGARKPIA